MPDKKRKQKRGNRQDELIQKLLSQRVRKFTTIEKYFYGAIILAAVMMAISIVYVQANITAVQSEMTTINQDIAKKEIELEETKQAVNSLTTKTRMMEIANKYGLVLNDSNLRIAE